MDTGMKHLILTIAVLLALAVACGREENVIEAPPTDIAWYASIKEAREHAEAGGNLVLMSFEASWDPWSQLLHDSLFVDSTVVESLLAFRCTRVDVDVDTLARREFGVRLYPTIVITDAYGSELGRIIGYQDPPLFLGVLALHHLHVVGLLVVRECGRAPEQAGDRARKNRSVSPSEISALHVHVSLRLLGCIDNGPMGAIESVD